MAKGKKTGGRQAGTPNKSTAEIKTYAQQFTAEAIDALVSILRNTKNPPQARVMSAKEILDRGHGKAPQAIVGDGDKPLEIVKRVVFGSRYKPQGPQGGDQ